MIVAEGCEVCHPLLRAEGPRQGEHHFAIRLGDHLLHVLFDGQKVWNCIEVSTGPGGWAICGFMNPWEMCECGSGKWRLYMDRADAYSVNLTGRKEMFVIREPRDLRCNTCP